MKIIGINEIAEMVESNNRIEKAEREIKKERIKELVAQGIDKALAKIMVESFIKCDL